MPRRPRRARRAGHTALVLQEVQNGVVGERSALPALTEAAAAVDLIPHCAALARRGACRSACPVFHCTAETRDDGKGANQNAALFFGVRKLPVQLSPGSDAVQVPGPDRRRSRRHRAARAITGSAR